MMRVVFATLFCLFLQRVVGTRRLSEQSINRHVAAIFEGEEKPVQECIYNDPIHLQCPETHHVEVVTAFWNRRKRPNCRGVEGVPYGTGLACNPNATDRIIAFCEHQAGNSCKLPAGNTGCKENPFTFMRIRWRCAEGVVDRVATSTTPNPAGDDEVVEEEEVEEEEEIVEEAMENEDLFEGDDLYLPTVAPIVNEEEAMPTVAPPAKKEKVKEEEKEWKKNTTIRLLPPSLTWDHCRLLSVGAWQPCTKVEKVGGFTSSPVFDGDSVCRCPYLAPFKTMTCDDLFVDHQSVHIVKSGMGKVAAFGYEGCDCSKNTEERGWWNCDLAVREV